MLSYGSHACLNPNCQRIRIWRLTDVRCLTSGSISRDRKELQKPPSANRRVQGVCQRKHKHRSSRDTLLTLLLKHLEQ